MTKDTDTVNVGGVEYVADGYDWIIDTEDRYPGDEQLSDAYMASLVHQFGSVDQVTEFLRLKNSDMLLSSFEGIVYDALERSTLDVVASARIGQSRLDCPSDNQDEVDEAVMEVMRIALLKRRKPEHEVT